MEKINVAELLKDCPSGMELDCTMFNDVVFDHISVEPNTHPIFIKIKNCNSTIQFTEYGQYMDIEDAKCVIFPKGKTTWEGFHRPFKDGDIIYIRDEYSDATFTYVAIFKQIEKGGHIYSHCFYNYESAEFSTDDFLYDVYRMRFASEEEKSKLFQAIKDNGYRWNPKTKTLENLFSYNIGRKVWVKSDKEHKYIHTIVGISRNSFGNLEYEVKEEKSGVVVHYPESLLIPVETKELKFKVGDKIVDIFRKHAGASGSQGVISKITDDKYIFTDGSYIYISSQDNWELEESVKPEFKVGDRIKHKTRISQGYVITEIKDTHYILNDESALPFTFQDEYEVVPNKFNINTLVPFESRVLVRNDEGQYWKPAIFGCYIENMRIPYYALGGNCWHQCIPYEGNEHLLGKTDDCDEYFKN